MYYDVLSRVLQQWERSTVEVEAEMWRGSDFAIFKIRAPHVRPRRDNGGHAKAH